MPAKNKKSTGKRKGRKKKSKKNILIFLWKFAAVSFLLGTLFFLLVFFGIFGPVPSKYQLQQINTPIASEVLSAEGKVLGRYYIENRSNVRFKDISKNVIDALIATEDARFYEHRGIDELALLRVFFKTIILQNRSSGGGSTLSQQIAKNLFPRENLGPISMPVNKLRESIIAYRLERIYTKEQILTIYLNTVPFAENIFGIEVAAERFFSKHPSNLTIPEAASIVGMLKANNYYNPRKNPERAKGRRNVVIDQMAKYNFISSQEADEYKSLPLEVKYRVISYNQGPAPYFLEFLKPQLLAWCKKHKKENGETYNLYTDGLKITTTLDYNLQHYAQLSVKEYMKNLQRVFNNHWKSSDIFQANPGVIKSAIYRVEQEKGNRISDSAYKEVLSQYQEKTHATLFTWDGLKDMETTRLDSLKHYLKLLNAGFLAIEPNSGFLKAWVGGIDYRFFQYDHVLSPRQTGSAFKPFVYLSALEQGVQPNRYFENKHRIYRKYNHWAPRNSHDEYGGYYTMKGALSKSLNTVSVDVLLETGIKNTINMAAELGISADMPDYPSLALGVASVSLKEMVEAYAGIVNDGMPVKTNYLVKIEDNAGNLLEEFSFNRSTKSVVAPENCRTVIQMMKAVVETGTGRGIKNIYKIPGDFAGKTGTTQNNSDGWFIGITPNLVTGCWVGADDPRVHFRTTTYGQGAYMALPIVGKFFSKTYKDPKFQTYKNLTFQLPEPQLLAMLNTTDFKEVMEVEKRAFDLAQIFSKKKKDEELKKVSREEVEEAKKNKGVWKLIKNIFKKKK